MTGYAHPIYAASLAEFGQPHHLPQCNGWILVRQIPDAPYQDAMGCYPLFACRDWSRLGADLKAIESKCVSLTLVADPFGDHTPELLARCFPDLCMPFKEHFVIDLERAPGTYVGKHHQRNARKGLRKVDVERCEVPLHFLDDWTQLYGVLVQRHGISGITAFSREAFAQQMKTPGFIAFRAVQEDATVGMVLWYVQDDRAYYHLGAYSDVGYASYASFALFWRALEYFSECGLCWLSLGAGAGARNDASDGLSRFKQGWSTETRTAYLCGRILNPTRYTEVVDARGTMTFNYFPAYRSGEFA